MLFGLTIEFSWLVSYLTGPTALSVAKQGKGALSLTQGWVSVQTLSFDPLASFFCLI